MKKKIRNMIIAIITTCCVWGEKVRATVITPKMFENDSKTESVKISNIGKRIDIIIIVSSVLLILFLLLFLKLSKVRKTVKIVISVIFFSIILVINLFWFVLLPYSCCPGLSY